MFGEHCSATTTFLGFSLRLEDCLHEKAKTTIMNEVRTSELRTCYSLNSYKTQHQLVGNK